jgi:hypothetical protein
MTTIVEAKREDIWKTDTVVKSTTIQLNKSIREFVQDRKDLSVKRLDDEHVAVLSKDKITIFLSQDSPWANFVDNSFYWNERQKLAFHNLCESLISGEEYDHSSYYEL